MWDDEGQGEGGGGYGMVRYRVRVGEMWGGVGGDWVRVGDRVKVGRGQGRLWDGGGPTVETA